MRLKPVYVVTIAAFLAGLVLIGTSQVLAEGQLREVLRDFGMVLGPIGLVSFLYELRLRQEFLKAIQEHVPGYLGSKQLVDLGERQIPEILRVLGTARNELCLMGGNLRILAFHTPRLAEIFASVRQVRILVMDGECEAARMRERQIGLTPGAWDYRRLFEDTVGAIREITERLGGAAQRLEVRTYDVPALHFLCLVDDRKMILNNYPYGGTGISFPHMFFDDCDTNAVSNGMMRRYRESFDFVWNNLSKPLGTRTPAQPAGAA